MWVESNLRGYEQKRFDVASDIEAEILILMEEIATSVIMFCVCYIFLLGRPRLLPSLSLSLPLSMFIC